jgi:CubicO group peptidase (beta-lactamase class C family)
VNRLEKSVLAKLGEEWREATPGLRIQAHSRGRLVADFGVGKTYRYYDWASLTKIVFSVTTLMFHHDQKKFRVTDPVSKWVDWFPETPNIRLRDLLSHSAGLTWWYPFYKEVSRKVARGASPEEAWRVFEGVLKRKVLRDVRERRGRAFTGKAVYSDLDFFLLGLTLESISEAPLYVNWLATREMLGLSRTNFHRENKAPRAKAQFAPTEKSPWHGRVLQGEVHDENTHSLRGVAPHAGLFGPIDDLSTWGLGLRRAMRGEKSKRFPSPETVALFTKRAIPAKRGDWALGFMVPTKGGSSSGPLFSPRSVGHTGFTGTSIWYDPDRDLLVTILSNRVHPTRENRAFLALRPKLHTWIAEEIG